MYMNYDNILCEECSNEINMQQKWNYNNKKINFIEIAYMKKYEYENEKYSNEIDEWNYYCIYCYDKETDIIKKGHIKFGSNFRILDCNLNLEERRIKYMNLDGILCEKCNQEINNHYYYCMSCHYKETDIIKKSHMESNFGILDCYLNLKERKAKYEKYNLILCEKCNNEIFKWNYYCTPCYNKETNVIEKGHIKFGSNFGILDYNLNLKKRRIKYMNFDGILCGKCNKEIDNQCYYCTACYNKETDLIKKGLMKFESNLEIFKKSDYNLNLEERRAKYMNYDGILCEICYNQISKWNYYCIHCYNKETADAIKKGHMKFGSNFEIFNTFDYNLNLKERRVKYMNYDGILCEKCNNDIYKWDYYCTLCYNKETDVIKKEHMKFGLNFAILDCNLNLKERRAKYMDYDGILCEICYNQISKLNYYCIHCYNKETDAIKKGHMKFGSNFEIFNTFDYNLNLKERMRKYMNYDCILCEKCSNEIDKQYYNCNNCYNNQMIINKCKVCFIGNNDNCCSFYEFKQYLENFSKWINENNVFKTSKVGISDYDLDEDDRRVKYKNFDYILCKKCDRKYHYNYCYECFDEKIREFSPKLQDYENFYFKVYKKETNELRELKELQSILIDYKNIYFKLNSNLGIFKQIIQKFENTKYYVLDKKILIDNIRYNGVHNCWRKLRSYCCNCYDREIDIIEKKRMEFGKCKECLKIHEDLDGCLSCNPKHFQRDFDKWTSRNEVIDKLIQDNQLSVRRYGLLEWIPYDKFININYIAEGGFAKVYSALWIDGQIRKWSQLSNSWRRNGSTTIALKVLNNSENISEDYLNEVCRK
ncbi:uncharacterized protein OCT59_004198 [Rhizophagus irregularis]|uniref:uncharacterized protein n=1 Tax=Rhizophagus irregularis TaxID=588596 RepID=UPI00331E3EDC|nr:hypothetical protein OCT59_004198 [Rhizophagus irregularis]